MYAEKVTVQLNLCYFQNPRTTRYSVTTALPQIEAYCLTLPAEAPVIIYCLDNSSFSQADGDGVITPIAKLADNRYHMVGKIIVAHEITMAAAVANLKRILAVCGGRKVFIITPLLRYINEFCCGEQAHCTHRLIPDSATKLLFDLGRLHRFIESRLSSFPLCEVIPAGDLLAAKHGASTSEILAAYSSWGPFTALELPTREWRSHSSTRC